MDYVVIIPHVRWEKKGWFRKIKHDGPDWKLAKTAVGNFEAGFSL